MIYTYTSMRPLSIGSYSSRSQNIAIRQYLESINLVFSIPHPEFVFPGCYLQLYNLLHKADQNSTLVFFSVSQLSELTDSYSSVCKKIVDKFDRVIFAREEVVINTSFNKQEAVSLINQIFNKTNSK